MAPLVLSIAGFLPLTAAAQAMITTVNVGTYPATLAINPVTGNVYVANAGGASVSVINGTTNAVVTVPTETDPSAIAVNSVTNKIYVASNDGVVTVIDGATNATTAVPTRNSAYDIEVNMVTNKVYVANAGTNTAPDNEVTVIDGATLATSTIQVGTYPTDIAVNPTTNMIYVDNLGENSVTVINGATTATTRVPVGGPPEAAAVDAVTNMIYVPCIGNVMAVINGATNATTSVPIGTEAGFVAVNPLTNMIYVTNIVDGTVTVVNGATNATTTVPVGPSPYGIAINFAANLVYVANSGVSIANDTGGASDYITVIDGATNATLNVTTGTDPIEVVVNQTTNAVYIGNSFSNTVSIIQEVAPPQVASSTRLINISTRAQVGTGANILIPGFVVAGSGTETLLIRGVGPGLSQFGVSGVLGEPSLSVFDSSGNMVASNTGWETNPNPALLASTAAAVGAFALPGGSSDSALIANLAPGAYTVHVSGVSNATGVALAEIYEVSASGTRLANISTRAVVGTGGNILIPGFVIAGTGSEQLLVRGDGPALTQFGLGGVLAEPSLSVFDSSNRLVTSNTGWGTSANPALLSSDAASVGAFALSPGSADSAQIVNLSSGAYTMQISGAGGTTGVALAEVYEIP